MNKEEQQKTILNDIFDKPVEFDDDTRAQNDGKNFTGNMRLNKGLYRTDAEKAKYLKESEERELP